MDQSPCLNGSVASLLRNLINTLFNTSTTDAMQSPPRDDLTHTRDGAAGTTPMRRRRHCRVTKSSPKPSPKTPTHPSNGYQIMEGEEELTPIKMSPVGIDFTLGEKGAPSSPPSNANDVSLDSNQSFEISRPSPSLPRDCDDGVVTVTQEDDEGVAVAVAQEGDGDGIADVTQDLDDRSLNVFDTSCENIAALSKATKAKPRRRRKSTADAASNRAARRRSLRLQSKVLDPLTPEKKAPPESANNNDINEEAGGVSCEPSCEPKNDPTVDLSTLAMMEDDDCAFKPSARRRSMRIRGKSLGCAVQSAEEPPPRIRGKSLGPVVQSAEELPPVAVGSPVPPTSSVASESPRKSPRKKIEAALSPAPVVPSEKSPTRRRSPRKKDAVVPSPNKSESPAAVVAKKRKAKRKRSAICNTVNTEQGDDVMLSPKKRSCDVKELPVVDLTMRLSDDLMSTPKKMGNIDAMPSPISFFGKTEVQASAFKKKAPTMATAFEIGMSENGEVQLLRALEKLAFNVVLGPSSFANVSKRKSMAGRCRSKKRNRPRSQ